MNSVNSRKMKLELWLYKGNKKMIWNLWRHTFESTNFIEKYEWRQHDSTLNQLWIEASCSRHDGPYTPHHANRSPVSSYAISAAIEQSTSSSRMLWCQKLGIPATPGCTRNSDYVVNLTSFRAVVFWIILLQQWSHQWMAAPIMLAELWGYAKPQGPG